MKQARQLKPVQLKPGMKVRVKRDGSHGGLFGAVGSLVRVNPNWLGEWVVLLPVQVGWGGNGGRWPGSPPGTRGALKEQLISPELLVPIKKQES